MTPEPATKTVNGRKAGKEQTRRQLIRSAHGLLAEKGIAGLTMNQISRAAGIAQPSFYNHFASVTELVVEVRHRMADKYLQPQKVRLETLLQGFTPGLSNLTTLIHDFLAFNFNILMRDVHIFKVVLADYHDPRSPVAGELGKLIDEINQAWCELLRMQLHEWELHISPSNLKIFVDSISALVHQLVLGCEVNRYTTDQAITTLTITSETLINHYLKESSL